MEKINLKDRDIDDLEDFLDKGKYNQLLQRFLIQIIK